MAWSRDEVFYTDDFMVDVMKIEKLPASLYQYTSAESLEKILQTRMLRFSRLDQVNDPEEATAADLPFASSTVFVSCWSSGESESIPMWSMYGNAFEGVRYRLPANMFAGRHAPIIWEEGGATTTVDSEWKIERVSPAMGTWGQVVIGPNKVYYSDDPAFRVRKIFYRDDKMVRYVPYDLGMVKATYWSYEEEWRFKIAALGFEAQFPDDGYFNEITQNLENYPILTKCLFVPLDPSALDEMQVVIGPRATKTTIEKVEAAVARFAPRATITRSTIAIR